MISIDYNIHNFPYDTFERINYQSRGQGGKNGSKKYKIAYKDIITAFDIETTSILEIEQACMYIWQFGFDGIGVVFGRTWEEYREFLTRLTECLNGMTLVVYVHNLSYEFQFLKGIFDFDSVLCTDSRKVLKAVSGSIEYRCSYQLTNMSLYAFTNKMNVVHKKLKGDLDYSLYRHYLTPLTDVELGYCRNDVLGLIEALKVQFELEKDNLYSVPLTSTGYVRRDTKREFAKSGTRGIAKNIIPNYRVFELLRLAFRGGNTHANRYYAGKTVKNLHSYDRQSSYPSELCNSKFPMSTFRKEELTPEKLHDRIYNKHRAVLALLTLRNVELKDRTWGCPYIPYSKCIECEGYTKDNGRILNAELLTICVTDLDYRIMESEYTFDMEIKEAYTATYGMLPLSFRKSVRHFYESKTKLKGVKGQELYYTKDKNKLNSEYGMAVQNPCKDVIEFIDNLFQKVELTKEEKEELFLKENNKDFLSYSWGVWTTANARYQLEKGIELAHSQGYFVYTDTDSVKFIGDVDFTEYNKEMVALSTKNKAYAVDVKGNTQYMGIYDKEADMRAFRTMGAKKYCYVTEDNVLHLTVSGVSKEIGARELEERGGIEAFQNGFTFYKGGGLECKYNDNTDLTCSITDYKGKVTEVHFTDNLFQRASTYKLGYADDYIQLLENIGNGYKY